MSDKKSLNLNRENLGKVKTKIASTPEEAAEMMAKYNQTMLDAQFNIMALLTDIAESLRDISVDLNDSLYYQKQTAIKEGTLSEIEIEEREKEEPEEPPVNSPEV